MKRQPAPATVPEALNQHATQKGVSLAALNEQSPVLLVFLRHFG